MNGRKDTRSSIVRAYLKLIEKARKESETDEDTERRLEREATR